MVPSPAVLPAVLATLLGVVGDCLGRDLIRHGHLNRMSCPAEAEDEGGAKDEIS